MTTPFWCLILVSVLPWFIAPVSGYFKTQQFDALDNKYPRLQSAQLTGAGARAIGAQENAWEALAVFGVAVVVAHLAGADPGLSATAALLFVAARIGHAIFYIANIDIARSGVFLVGVGCIIWLFVLAGSA